MGRPPSNGAPSFRFHPSEVSQMEAILEKHEGHVPPRDILVALAQRFSQSPERAGKITVQMKQIWNWFQNKRYALRAKLVKSVAKSTTTLVTRNEATPVRNLPPFPQAMSLSSGALVVRNTPEAQYMEFEARSSRDGAWYDVQEFLAHRYIETGNPEVLVQFSGFGPDEDEWRNIRKHVRQRSLPCEAPECIAVLPGDLILCFQEGKEQALYFDAHVLDAQRRSHDIRGCRCRFLVRFDHDQSEEIVPLRKICRRPETDHRLQQQHSANAAVAAAAAVSVSVEPPVHLLGQTNNSTLGITNPNPSTALGTLIKTASTSASVKPPVHVLSQTNNTTFEITAPNPSTAPASLISAASTPVSFEPLVHPVGQTNTSIFGITNPNLNPNPSTALVSLIPTASTPVSAEPLVHTVGQTNNSIFGITNPNPSTATVSLIPTVPSPVSAEPLVHTVGQTNNNLFGIRNPNLNTASGQLFPSPVLRTGRSGRHLFGPSASPTSQLGTPTPTMPPGFTPVSTSLQAVTVPASPAPPGFTPLSTSVVTQSPISTSVQAPVGLGVSTAVSVPVFPASLTPSTSFSEQNKVPNDNPAQIPAYAPKTDTDRPTLQQKHKTSESNHPLSVYRRIKVENVDPAPIPESNRAERVNLATSFDEARAHANFTIPVELTTVLEATKLENNDPKTPALTRSNVPDVHPTSNPAILVPGQAQTESSGAEKLKE